MGGGGLVARGGGVGGDGDAKQTNPSLHFTSIIGDPDRSSRKAIQIDVRSVSRFRAMPSVSSLARVGDIIVIIIGIIIILTGEQAATPSRPLSG